MPAVDDEAQIAPVVLTRPLKAPRTLTVPEDEVPPKPLPPSCPIQVMRIIVVGESAPLDEAPPVIEPLEHDDDAEEIEAEVEEEIESAPVQQAEPMEIIEVELAVDVEPPLLDEAAAPVSSRIAPPPPPIGERKARAERKAAELLSKPKRRAWWEELFNEEFSRASLRRSDDLVRREADFIEHSLGLEPGATILDLGCGDGHHAVELAGRGYAMVGYDLSLYQLALAADMAQERRLKINFLQGDMRELSFEEMFDGVYSFNTSFGYFEEDKNVVVAQRIFRALRPGGTLLLDVANRDFITANTPCQQWYEGDTCVCMDDANVDYITSRLSVKRSVIMDDGRTLECHYSIRLYSLHELGKLLHDVGFRIAEASGHIATRGVFFGQSSPRILILAQRP